MFVLPGLLLGSILGAAIAGGFGTFLGGLLGLLLGLLASRIVVRRGERAILARGADLAQRAGAPPPPYPLDPRDRACAARLTSLLPGTFVLERVGEFGPILEVKPASDASVVIASFSTVWNPDSSSFHTMMFCLPELMGVGAEVIAGAQLMRVGAAAGMEVFHRP